MHTANEYTSAAVDYLLGEYRHNKAMLAICAAHARAYYRQRLAVIRRQFLRVRAGQ